MATSLYNRQFRLQSGRNSSIQQTDSPSREIKPSAPSSYPSSNEEDEQLDWSDAIKRANIELEPPIRDAGTADQWIERNPGLIRLTGRHPFNSEPPLTRLMQSGFITPAAIHFVRNHGVVPRGSWQDWSVEVTGLVRRPKKFTMDELVSEFTSQEFPVTLLCAGNRRKEQNMTKQTIGFNWGPGAISTSVWRGIPLREVLLRCGIIMGTSMNVCFEGAEDLPGGGGSKYGTSVRAGIAMDPARDIIIAYMQNGEMLSPDHGFPVRMIIPGFIGGRMVKWLKRIVVSTEESDSYYHYKDNRVLPSHVDAELADAEAWWYKPEYIINELNINSVITRPSHQDILMINSSTAQKPYTLGGYAYSGGGRKVTRVEVTLDEGETWVAAELEHQEKPNKYGKYWCWCFWSLEVEVLHLLEASNIGVRAWDESLNIQPEKLIWNVMGMMNNCWFKVKTNVCKGPEEGEIGIVFEHPTQPGNKAGGWMAKERYLEYSMQVAPTMKKSLSSPFMNNAATKYPLSEVKNHNTADSCWIVVHGYVYDCTRFLNDHPGGSDSILINAGSDCTEEFDTIHSDKAKKLIQKYRIGELTWSSENEAGYALKKIPCRLIEKVSLSHDVRRFRLALPSGDLTLGLPVGKHVLLCDTIEGKLCMRAYTPTTTNEDGGYFDLVVKVYFKGEHPEYPSGGLMSQHLDSLPLGSTVKVKGPLGHIEYSGRGRFSAHGKHPTASRLAMIAGGTGITPIYQVMQSVLSDPGDQTVMYLVYANRTEDDIIMREELDGWAQDHPDRVNVWYVVQESVRVGWKYDIGLITESVLREHVPSGSHDTLALACGPPPMIQFAVIPNLKKMGYDINNDLLVF